MIPEAAVEAAAKGIFAIRDDAYDMDEWEDLDSTDRELFTCQARAALEAAAPHMRPDFRESNLKAILDELAKPLFPIGKIEDRRRHGND